MRLSRRRVRAFIRQQPARRLVLVLLLTVAGGAVTIHTALGLKPAPPHTPAPTVITYSTDHPAEDKPKPTTYRWAGAATMPKYLNFPSIGAEGFVQQVGVDQHKAIAVPTNIHLAGWFVNSRLPGAEGLSIIDGHLDGRTGGGIFEHLAQLQTGDRFTVTYGNNATKTFAVRKVQSLAIADAASALFSQDPNVSHQLNLITCGGTFDTAKHQYDERVLVIAELVSGER